MRWVARYFARAVVRRVAYLAVAGVLALVLQLCSQSARAQEVDTSHCFDKSNTAYYCGDEGEAVSALYSYMAWSKAGAKGYYDNCVVNAPTGVGSGEIFVRMTGGNCGSSGVLASRKVPVGKTCTARNAAALADAKMWYTPAPTCISGCQVQGEAITQTVGSVTAYGMRNRTYSGQVCSPQVIDANAPISNADSAQKQQDATKPKQPECTALGGGMTACLASNGDHCTTSSTGKTFCWTPTEVGKKVDGVDAQVKSKKGDAVTPPDVSIPDKDWQRTQGHQQTACLGTTCITYNVTNYQSVPAGTAKNGTGDNTVDGSGNTSGNGAPGKGTKDGDEDGDSDSASDSGNCTTPPTCTGDTLKCLHLKFTWKNQCNTTHNEVTKGDGCDAGDVPVCAGSSCKAEAYAQLLQQWRARCDGEAIRKGVEGQAGQGDGDDGQGSIFIHDDGPGASLNEGLVTYGAGTLGYDFDVEGVSFKIPQQVLDFLPILRMLIIAAASLAAIGIMRGNG
jgi:hypothetical protein